MMDRSRRWFTVLPMFDPEKGTTVIEPPGTSAGYWAGAGSVLAHGNETFLYYRLRRPRGEEPDRGYECHVAASQDGIHFTDALRIGKDELQTTSMERSCLVDSGDGKFRLYISYVDKADGRWRIDMMEAGSPSGFRASDRVACLTAAACGCEGVKDPWVFRVGDRKSVV